MTEGHGIKQALLPRLLDFPQPEDQVLLEYVFFGNTSKPLSKTRVVDFEPMSVEECPMWEEGHLAPNEILIQNNLQTSEIFLKPVGLYRDPFRKGRNKLVLCEAFQRDMSPTDTNTRALCREAMDKFKDEEAWFGIEQEYIITDYNDWPLGYKNNCDFELEDVHAGVSYAPTSGLERQLAETHLQACMYIGLKMWGLVKEDVPAVWEFQLQPCDGLEASDQLMIARYIMLRLAELFEVKVSFSCPEHWYRTFEGGLSVTHINFSTRQMREDGGMAHIEKAMERLSRIPQTKLIKLLDGDKGLDPRLRLIGGNYCPHYDEFKWSVGNKWDTSVRIPMKVGEEGKGYFEERRLGPDIDPYRVTSVYIKAVLEDVSSLL